mgnify:CR=1 FL=1
MEVKGFPNYLIYDDGRCFSKYKSKFLQPMYNRGYEHLALYTSVNRKDFYSHRLVAIHYIPNPDNLPQVDHIDGNKTNNHFSNLRWMSGIQNANSFKKHYSNNRSGIKNICFDEVNVRWKYDKTIYGKLHRKYFKTKDEAIAYKTEYEGLIER